MGNTMENFDFFGKFDDGGIQHFRENGGESGWYRGKTTSEKMMWKNGWPFLYAVKSSLQLCVLQQFLHPNPSPAAVQVLEVVAGFRPDVASVEGLADQVYANPHALPHPCYPTE